MSQVLQSSDDSFYPLLQISRLPPNNKHKISRVPYNNNKHNSWLK